MLKEELALEKIGWTSQWFSSVKPENSIAAKSNYWCVEISPQSESLKMSIVYVVWPTKDDVSVELYATDNAHVPYEEYKEALRLGYELFETRTKVQDE